jgi:predicted lipoprotein with Yx(FWY)xxD motif
MMRYRMSSVAAIIGVALLVAACGGGSTTSKPSATTPAAPASTTPASSTAASVSISAMKGPHGTYLTGASGRALYLWVADSNGQSACMGACAKAWTPVVSSSTPTVSGGVNASDLGTTTRPDRTKQVTYKGHPLYYFIADPTAGTTHGQGNNGFGAKWWLVSPSGTAITANASSSTGSSSSGPSGGSSSNGGGAYSSGGSG